MEFQRFASVDRNPYITVIGVNDEKYIEPDGKYNLLNILGIGVETFNPNPLGFSNGEDCAVRAICALLYVGDRKVTEQDYTDVYMGLAETGLRQGRIVNHVWTLADFLKRHGYVAVSPKDHVTVGSFIYAHKHGRYIISFSTHVFAYIDGFIYDTNSDLEHDEMGLGCYVDVIYCPEDEARTLFD